MVSKSCWMGIPPTKRARAAERLAQLGVVEQQQQQQQQAAAAAHAAQQQQQAQMQAQALAAQQHQQAMAAAALQSAPPPPPPPPAGTITVGGYTIPTVGPSPGSPTDTQLLAAFPHQLGEPTLAPHFGGGEELDGAAAALPSYGAVSAARTGPLSASAAAFGGVRQTRSDPYQDVEEEEASGGSGATAASGAAAVA